MTAPGVLVVQCWTGDMAAAWQEMASLRRRGWTGLFETRSAAVRKKCRPDSWRLHEVVDGPPGLRGVRPQGATTAPN